MESSLFARPSPVQEWFRVETFPWHKTSVNLKQLVDGRRVITTSDGGNYLAVERNILYSGERITLEDFLMPVPRLGLPDPYYSDHLLEFRPEDPGYHYVPVDVYNWPPVYKGFEELSLGEIITKFAGGKSFIRVQRDKKVKFHPSPYANCLEEVVVLANIREMSFPLLDEDIDEPSDDDDLPEEIDIDRYYVTPLMSARSRRRQREQNRRAPIPERRVVPRTNPKAKPSHPPPRSSPSPHQPVSPPRRPWPRRSARLAMKRMREAYCTDIDCSFCFGIDASPTPAKKARRSSVKGRNISFSE